MIQSYCVIIRAAQLGPAWELGTRVDQEFESTAYYRMDRGKPQAKASFRMSGL